VRQAAHTRRALDYGSSGSSPPPRRHLSDESTLPEKTVGTSAMGDLVAERL
jgi:hypothetical protein